MTWHELGEGLQAVRDGRDLPHRVAEGLLGLGYIAPGATVNDPPTLTLAGQTWLDGIEQAQPARRATDTEVELLKAKHLNDMLKLVEGVMFRQPDPRD